VTLCEIGQRFGNLAQLVAPVDDRLRSAALDELSQCLEILPVRLRHEPTGLLAAAEHGEQHFAEGAHHGVGAFELGLDLILDGLRELHASS
jgi:hypothetical protein